MHNIKFTVLPSFKCMSLESIHPCASFYLQNPIDPVELKLSPYQTNSPAFSPSGLSHSSFTIESD